MPVRSLYFLFFKFINFWNISFCPNILNKLYHLFLFALFIILSSHHLIFSSHLSICYTNYVFLLMCRLRKRQNQILGIENFEILGKIWVDRRNECSNLFFSFFLKNLCKKPKSRPTPQKNVMISVFKFMKNGVDSTAINRSWEAFNTSPFVLTNKGCPMHIKKQKEEITDNIIANIQTDEEWFLVWERCWL